MPRKKGGEVTPRRLSDLEPHRRRAVVIRAVVSIALMWVASLTVYYLAPIGRAGRAREGLWLVIGLLLVGVLVFRRTRQILAADFPGLRAVEGLAVILPLFLLVFAALYLALSQVTASSFSQELDHTRALYFAITVFATVGFGDITPTTNTARIIREHPDAARPGTYRLVVRLFINAAKSRLGTPPEDPSNCWRRTASPCSAAACAGRRGTASNLPSRAGWSVKSPVAGGARSSPPTSAWWPARKTRLGRSRAGGQPWHIRCCSA
jgi:voltage-gated potassium channel